MCECFNVQNYIALTKILLNTNFLVLRLEILLFWFCPFCLYSWVIKFDLFSSASLTFFYWYYWHLCQNLLNWWLLQVLFVVFFPPSCYHSIPTYRGAACFAQACTLCIPLYTNRVIFYWDIGFLPESISKWHSQQNIVC